MPVQKDRFPILLFFIILSQIFAASQLKKSPKKNGGFMFRKFVGLMVIAGCCWNGVALGGLQVQCCYRMNSSTGIYETVTAESCLKCPSGCNDLCTTTIDPPITIGCADECKGMTSWGNPQGTLFVSSYQTRCADTYCEYRCKAGYYGTGKNCSLCASPGTSAVASTKATDCYITGGSDTTGSFEFSGGKCYYN